MDLKKTYYYIICLVSLFVVFWGLIDLCGAAVGLTMVKDAGPAADLIAQGKASDQLVDIYYQKKMLYDRLADSLARLLIAGLVFGYSRIKISRMEK